MPYYGDGAMPYYYAGGPFANHSSLMTGVGRSYHNPIAARYSPHLSTISETPFVTPFVTLRRYSPAVSGSTATSLGRPRRTIDTADIDVSKPPRSLTSENRQQRHQLRRDRPTIKIRSQALKDNPALREYNERHEKTVGELLVEKFLIKDKQQELPRMRLYHQPSLQSPAEEPASTKERDNEILAAIRRRVTRRMTRRRSSADVQPLDPEQIEREAAFHAIQAEALDSLVAQEQKEIEVEMRRGTFTKRQAMRLAAQPSESDDEELQEVESRRSRPTATRKKKRRKSLERIAAVAPLRSDEEDEDELEEESILEIPESVIEEDEEEDFQWDDRDKCDDVRKLIPFKSEDANLAKVQAKDSKLNEIAAEQKRLKNSEIDTSLEKAKDSKLNEIAAEQKRLKNSEINTSLEKAKDSKLNEIAAEQKRLKNSEIDTSLEKAKDSKLNEIAAEQKRLKNSEINTSLEKAKDSKLNEIAAAEQKRLKNSPIVTSLEKAKDSKLNEIAAEQKRLKNSEIVTSLEKAKDSKLNEIAAEQKRLKNSEIVTSLEKAKDSQLNEIAAEQNRLKNSEIDTSLEKAKDSKLNEIAAEQNRLKNSEIVTSLEKAKDSKLNEIAAEQKRLKNSEIVTSLEKAKDSQLNEIAAEQNRLKNSEIVTSLEKEAPTVAELAAADTSSVQPEYMEEKTEKKVETRLTERLDPIIVENEKRETVEAVSIPVMNATIRQKELEKELISEKSEKKVRTRKKGESEQMKVKRTVSVPLDDSPRFKVEACNSVGDFSTLFVRAAEAAERKVEQFRESIRLPAPRRAQALPIETEVVLPVRRPYVRDTSRNSVYLALKPSQRPALEDTRKPLVVQQAEQQAEQAFDRQTTPAKAEAHRSISDAEAADRCTADCAHAFVAWSDETEEEAASELLTQEKSASAPAESDESVKLQLDYCNSNAKFISEAKEDSEAAASEPKAILQESVVSPIPEKQVQEPKLEELKVSLASEKKSLVKVEEVKKSKVSTEQVKAAGKTPIPEEANVTSFTDKKSLAQAKVSSKEAKVPRVEEKKVRIKIGDTKKSTAEKKSSVERTQSTQEEYPLSGEHPILARREKAEERKGRVIDAEAVMKIEKRILEEAESPRKILTGAIPEADAPPPEKVGLATTTSTKKSAAEPALAADTEIDFWSEMKAEEVSGKAQSGLRLECVLDARAEEDEERTPLVEGSPLPLIPLIPLCNGRRAEEEEPPTAPTASNEPEELSGTVKKISKWENRDNLADLEADADATPVVSASSSTTSTSKKKLVKRKKSTATGKKKPDGDSSKSKTSTRKAAAKKTAASPQTSQLKAPPVAASSRNTPAQRPADLMKMFYTTPAILLTATPRDLRKVRRAKVKRKKPPTRTPSLSSDSTGSTRSTATTSTEEGSNCEEDAEHKRLASTRSNDSGFDGSPRLSNCDMVCHKKCEKLTGNLCGLNQKLVAEALQALKKAPSQSSENQRNVEGEHYQHSGRITPPATNLPRFKKYEVSDFNFLKVLGKGSFGKVLLAELRGTECVYAVKCLKKDVVLEDDDVECTLIERKVLTLATRHPYLCHLFCTFQTESHLFFVMEYLNGGDLMFHIQKSGRFSKARAKFYAAEIWSGLIFLHKKGIVYRDLKLDNVLLDFEGHIRIADFGMCKLQIFLDRTADTFCGTPDYMAPEIIKGLKYNQAVDWWSFGVLLYEMLTGQSPFSGCDEDELFWSICNERPFIPRYLSQSSTDILVCLLEKDAGKRIPGHEIACHTFFCTIAWDKLERRSLEPPFKPAVEHTLDTRYFDTAFTTERPRLTPVPEQILTSMDQAVFRGFSYTNPNATD